MLSEVEQKQIQLYGITHSACAGLSTRKKNSARQETDEWLANMTPEQLAEHYKREQEYQEKKKGNFIY